MKPAASVASLALLCACLTAGCGRPEAGDAGATSALPKIAACATGRPLPLTGLCSDGDPSLFLAVDRSIKLFADKCVWRTEEVQLSEADILLFRTQDCVGQGWDRTIYSYVSGYLKQRPASSQPEEAGFALQIFDVPKGQTAEQVAMGTLAQAPEDQRTRCATKPRTGVKLAGRAFDLAPNAELTAELSAANPDEPWDACGPDGFTQDATQFWEGRDTHALFHTTGQDTPPWDPASFTFYHKGADGRWTKAG